MVRHRTVFPRPSIQSFPDLRQADRCLPALRRSVTTSGQCGTHGWPSHPISSWSHPAEGGIAILVARFITRPIPEICAMGGVTPVDCTKSGAYLEIFGLGG